MATKKQKYSYEVVEADADHRLEDAIESMYEQGYRCVGGMSVVYHPGINSGSGGLRYFQAMELVPYKPDPMGLPG